MVQVDSKPGARPKVDRKARFKVPPQKIPKQDPAERIHNWDEVFLGFDPETAILEATRCIQCPAQPCVDACPLHNDIPGALWHLENGDFIGAANRFRETSSMPEICGRICPQERLCEGECVVGSKKDPEKRPVAIGKLEAFVSDFQRKRGGFPTSPKAAPTGKKVAVVGSGPAGLTVGEILAARGHSVTIFDSWPKPGGVLRYGIPNFKLSKKIVEEKIHQLEEMGVEFRTNVTIGKGPLVDDFLTKEGFQAVFLGHGAGIGASARVPGEDLKGVFSATEFLVRCHLGPEELPPAMRNPIEVGRRVVVIGGGDTAMDCVRTAMRMGAQEVTCAYRRTEAEMPGRVEERHHAKEEGVQFHFLAAPVKFVRGEDGQVKRVECLQMELGEPDASGRRRPIPIEGSEFFIEADTVVLAVGYWPDPFIGETTPGLETHHDGLIVIDEASGATTRLAIYAGGDNVRGADLVVTAIADARLAAQAINEYLQGL